MIKDLFFTESCFNFKVHCHISIFPDILSSGNLLNVLFGDYKFFTRLYTNYCVIRNHTYCYIMQIFVVIAKYKEI